MHKGECFITKVSSAIYRLVGRWGKALVLSSISDSDETVLMYSPAEFEEMIGTGQYRKLYPTGIKIKDQ